jgi:hypothetical protein
VPVIPTILPEKDQSPKAERSILERFQESDISSSLSKYLFHSIRIKRCGKKKVGEVDFIYLDNEYMIFFEVKGGEVSYEADRKIWTVMNGTLEKDPWKQASDYLYCVINDLLPTELKSKYLDQKLKFGYGVLFPQSGIPEQFQTQDEKLYGKRIIEYDLELLYSIDDHTNRDKGVTNYLERVLHYWNRHPSNSGRRGISDDELSLLKNFVASSICFKPTLTQIINYDDEQTAFLTQSQAKILDVCIVNPDSSFVIEGGPGTGKTILALELAFKFSESLEDVLLLCYNRPLSDYLNLEVEKANNDLILSEEGFNHLQVSNLDKIVLSKVKSVDPDYNFSDPSREDWIKLKKHYLSLSSKLKEEDKYDRVIVDEGQDLMNDIDLHCLGQLLRGGLDSEKWIIFLDRKFQILYENNFSEEALNKLKIKYKYILLKLDVNCRNTQNILSEACLNTGFVKQECQKQGGKFPEMDFYNSTEELVAKVGVILKIFRSEGRENDIAIIVDSVRLKDELRNSISGLIDLNRLKNKPKGNIFIDTDRRFKGLDCYAIIYISTDLDFDDEALRSRIYVAETRAKGFLYQIFNEKDRQPLNDFRSSNFRNII